MPIHDYNTMKTTTRIKDIITRIEDLERANEITSENFAIFREIASIISEVKELPVGRLVMNRALNRHKLNYLKFVVLPRRQKQLIEIHELKKMPSTLRKEFVDNELQLIKSATRSIIHRERFEKEAAEKVQYFFSNLFRNVRSTTKLTHQQKGM